jgi:hypothetical protein
MRKIVVSIVEMSVQKIPFMYRIKLSVVRVANRFMSF